MNEIWKKKMNKKIIYNNERIWMKNRRKMKIMAIIYEDKAANENNGIVMTRWAKTMNIWIWNEDVIIRPMYNRRKKYE